MMSNGFRMLEKIRDAVGEFQGKTIAVLGLAFKPNTDDIRHSPALYLAEQIMKAGGTVRTYYLEALEVSMKVLPAMVPCQDAYQAMEGADAVKWLQNGTSLETWISSGFELRRPHRFLLTFATCIRTATDGRTRILLCLGWTKNGGGNLLPKNSEPRYFLFSLH